MKDRNYKCPVCGAPVEGEKCEYCGCVIYDFAVIDPEHPFYIRLLASNYDGKKYILNAKVICQGSFSVDINSEEYDITNSHGQKVMSMIKSQTMDIHLDLTAIVDDNNTLFTVVPADRPYRESWRDDIEDAK